MMKKVKNKQACRKFIKLLILIVSTICLLSFITYSKSRDDEIIKEFYSKQVVSENINHGVKVTIVKSDKYGNNQDEFTSVDITVENLNMYSDLDFIVEAINHDEFKTIGKSSKNETISSDESIDISFDYAFKNSTRKYEPKKEKSTYKRDYYIHASGSEIREKSTDSSLRYIREREEIQNEYKPEIVEEKQPAITYIFIIAVIVIFVILCIFIIIMIRKNMKDNDDFYNFFLIIGLTLIILICSIANKSEVYAYNQQTFSYNTEYSDIYTVEVYHQGRAYTFRYRVSYKFLGEMPVFDPELDSDGDGLPDVREVYFMTDRFNVDTDEDGISDYDEVYIIDTNPLVKDTDKNGIEDCDEDFDKDGLTNKEEYIYNTYLNDVDTDTDGLSDGEEIKKYHTDPTNVDTDGDGITDYEEVEIAKKLGISDFTNVSKSTKVEQELDRNNFAPPLYMDNVVKMSISGNTYGLIENHINVKAENPVALDKVGSILGRVANIVSDYDDLVEVTFDVSNYSVKKEALKVATYVDGKIKLLNTNLSDNNISANVKDGYVFVLDVDRYVDDILAYKKDNYK